MERYDEGVGSLVLDAYDFAELPEPAFEIVLCCVFAVALHIDLGVANSGRHVETLIIYNANPELQFLPTGPRKVACFWALRELRGVALICLMVIINE